MSMTKEQEEAIDYVQKQIDYFKKQIKFIEAVDRTYYEAEYKLYKNRVKQFETVLNMLKEKDEKIESLEKTLDKRFIYVTEARTVYSRLMQLDKESIVQDDLKRRNELNQCIKAEEKYKELYHKALGDLVKADRENIKKDKIIDGMTKYIFQNVDVEEDICNSAYVECTQETAQDITCISCIRQYFEREVNSSEQ